MASITWTDVTDHAAELSSVAVNAQTNILAWVNTALVVDEFGGETSAKLKLARIYLAAHFASVESAASGGTAGPVTSEAAGSISRSYGSVYSLDPSLLSTTGYGQNYLMLVRTSPARAPVLL